MYVHELLYNCDPVGIMASFDKERKYPESLSQAVDMRNKGIGNQRLSNLLSVERKV